MGWVWVLVPVALIALVISPALLYSMVTGRRRFLLDRAREEARIAEAKVRAQELAVREQELAHKRAELAYREALLELERFDRRTGGGPLGDPSRSALTAGDHDPGLPEPPSAGPADPEPPGAGPADPEPPDR